MLGCLVDLEPSCDGPGPVLARAPRGGLDKPMPGQGLDFEEGLGDAVANVFAAAKEESDSKGSNWGQLGGRLGVRLLTGWAGGITLS